MAEEKVGKIRPVEITDEMKKSYLDYAMSVIVARALPDVRDGLKPVHRRILYAMHKMGVSHQSAYTKSAKIVGETMGKYHPHGDMPIYDALVRLAQKFSMRYPLVDGQGNFGSVDGDPPAAMRYTEAKMAKISQELLSDLDKETVEFSDNFDGSLKEPLFLPALLPNLLLMGSEGIAVGMATRIPPHNLGEVVDALVTLIEKGRVVPQDGEAEEEFDIKRIQFDQEKANVEETPKIPPMTFESEATVEDLTHYIKGPDFPTGAAIYNSAEIKEAYATGRGKISVRAIAEITEAKMGLSQIVISQIPYQVNKAALVAKIAQLAKDKKVDGVRDLRDESDREGMRIVVDLSKNARPQAVLNKLYKFTSMQTTYPVNMVALVDGTPQTLSLKAILTEYIRHRQKVATDRSLFELKSARARVHILEGLKIALDNLDEVIETIKRSRDVDSARTNLMTKFKLSEIQANAILEMQLRRLAALERKKIEDEYREVGQKIKELIDLLSHPEKIIKVIKGELLQLKKDYADPRKTKVYAQPLGEFAEEDLIPRAETIVTLTASGYAKRVPRGTYRTQRRGGKGVSGITTKEEDTVVSLTSASTHDSILFFTDRGRVFSIRAWEIPEGSRQARGQAVINLINIEQGEEVQSILALPETLKEAKNRYLLMVTRRGTVKKTKIEEFANIRSSGLIAIKLAKGDSLSWVDEVKEGDHILLASHEGKAIRFDQADVRPTGRATMGVRGMRLKKGDFVVGMDVFAGRPKKPKDRRRKFFLDILVVMENGLGKRTAVDEFHMQKRGGLGVKVAQVTKKTGKVVASQLVDQTIEDVVITSKAGQVIKLPLRNIPQLGRATQGVILMRFKEKGDSVGAVACLGKKK